MYHNSHPFVPFQLQSMQTFPGFSSPAGLVSSSSLPWSTSERTAPGWGRFSRVTAATRDGFSGRLSHSNGFPSPRHDDRRRDWWRCPTTAALSHPLHIQHTPVNLVALIFHSATFNLQINPSEKIPWLVGLVSNSILHFIASGISKCIYSLTHKTHVCSITQDRLVNARY